MNEFVEILSFQWIFRSNTEATWIWQILNCFESSALEVSTFTEPFDHPLCCSLMLFRMVVSYLRYSFLTLNCFYIFCREVFLCENRLQHFHFIVTTLLSSITPTDRLVYVIKIRWSFLSRTSQSIECRECFFKTNLSSVSVVEAFCVVNVHISLRSSADPPEFHSQSSGWMNSFFGRKCFSTEATSSLSCSLFCLRRPEEQPLLRTLAYQKPRSFGAAVTAVPLGIFWAFPPLRLWVGRPQQRRRQMWASVMKSHSGSFGEHVDGLHAGQKRETPRRSHATCF